MLPVCSAAGFGSGEAADWIQLLLYQVNMNAEEGSWEAAFIYRIFFVLKR